MYNYESREQHDAERAENMALKAIIEEILKDGHKVMDSTSSTHNVPWGSSYSFEE